MPVPLYELTTPIIRNQLNRFELELLGLIRIPVVAVFCFAQVFLEVK